MAEIRSRYSRNLAETQPRHSRDIAEVQVHAFQTAESIREAKLPDWMQLVGLIHDCGKMVYLRGCDEDGTSVAQQWSLVGDTWLVTCHL